MSLLAIHLDASGIAVIAVVGIMILGVAYFALRFWLVSTRPPDIKEVRTPNLDRMNRDALAHLGDEEDDDDDDAPAGLKEDLPPRLG